MISKKMMMRSWIEKYKNQGCFRKVGNFSQTLHHIYSKNTPYFAKPKADYKIKKYFLPVDIQGSLISLLYKKVIF